MADLRKASETSRETAGRPDQESLKAPSPPSFEGCREAIQACSRMIAEIIIGLAYAQADRERVWLKLFEATDDRQKALRDAIGREVGGAREEHWSKLRGYLRKSLETIADATRELEVAETLVKALRDELATAEAKKRLFEFWREYHLVRGEVERLSFRGESVLTGSAHSTADLRQLEERIRKINRNLPAGYKPIPNISPQTILYVPSSSPGEYVPK